MTSNRNLKEPLSFDHQVDKLKDHNMEVDNTALALEAIKTKGYYRLSGYALQYRKSEHESDLVGGTPLNKVIGAYDFDSNLRMILRYYLEITEVYYRVQISNIFSQIKCSVPPYDQHYDESNFYARDWHAEIFSSFNRDARKNYSDNPIIIHHINSYGGRMPLWVIVEFLSFSNLSKLYNAMYESEQISIASAVGTGQKTLKNHLHCMSVLRNKCAHCAQLYGRKLVPESRFNRTFRKNNPDIDVASLFAYILVLLKNLPTEEAKDRFIREIVDLVNTYRDVIELQMIGFPDDYERRMNKYR